MNASSGTAESEKSELRSEATRRRAEAHAARAAAAAQDLVRLFAAALGDEIDTAAVVALYWPIRTEIDVRPLMQNLGDRGTGLALPVVGAPDSPLAFRSWCPGDAMRRGVFGIEEPLETAPAATPDIVVTPLLGFDGQGHRLGYGGGYYDRSLRALRASGDVRAVGVAFDEQEFAAVPSAANDEILDMVVTDRRQIVISAVPVRAVGNNAVREPREK